MAALTDRKLLLVLYWWPGTEFSNFFQPIFDTSKIIQPTSFSCNIENRDLNSGSSKNH
jgi:hypothetical protein